MTQSKRLVSTRHRLIPVTSSPKFNFQLKRIAMPTSQIKVSDSEIYSRIQMRTNISLDETLRPLWKLTHCCGILCDWCRPISTDNHRFFKVARFVWIIFLMLLLFAMVVFEIMQSVTGNSPNIHVTISITLWFVPLLVGFIVQEQFLRHRRELLRFFEDWRALENEIMQLNRGCMCKSRKMHLTMYAIHAGMTIAGLIALGLAIFIRPEAPYLISSYQTIRDTLPQLLICIIHLTPIGFTLTFICIGDLVPSFTYYHAALGVDFLEKNVAIMFSKHVSKGKSIASSANKHLKIHPESSLASELCVSIHLVWNKFDKIDGMVDRANSLFGTFWVCSQGASIFLITLLIYSLFYHLNNGALEMRSIEQILPFVLTFAGVTFRLFSSTLISSRLYQLTVRFRRTLNHLLNQHWFELSKQDQDMLRSFLSRLSTDCLIASPLGLYNITPSIALSILGLVVSYVIVLLQTK